MHCPNCRAEFRSGFTVCSDCDVALVDELGAIPVESDAEESSAELQPFHETWSSDELAAILESLEESRVPYVVQAGTALALLTGSAFHGEELPGEWHARILVPGTGLSAAREILRQLKEMARSAAVRGAREPI